MVGYIKMLRLNFFSSRQSANPDKSMCLTVPVYFNWQLKAGDYVSVDCVMNKTCHGVVSKICQDNNKLTFVQIQCRQSQHCVGWFLLKKVRKQYWLF